MSLKEELQQQLKEAMRSGDHFRRDTLRMMLAEIKQAEIDSRAKLDDETIVEILIRQVRQREETVRDAQKANRPDIAATATAEIELIETYLPRMMSEEEVEPIVAHIVAEVEAESPKDMGRVLSVAIPRLRGKADSRLISQVARDLLSR